MPAARRARERIVRDDHDGRAVGVHAIEQIGDLLAGPRRARRSARRRAAAPADSRARGRWRPAASRRPRAATAGDARDRSGRRSRAARACATVADALADADFRLRQLHVFPGKIKRNRARFSGLFQKKLESPFSHQKQFLVNIFSKVLEPMKRPPGYENVTPISSLIFVFWFYNTAESIKTPQQTPIFGW